jgi:hypothetical protein
MAQNVIYVKYKDLNAVKMKIAASNGNEPLVDVSDLIVAFKTAVSPRLDLIPLDQLSLHLSHTSDDQIPIDTLLVKLNYFILFRLNILLLLLILRLFLAHSLPH